jgi:hypothetical protein
MSLISRTADLFYAFRFLKLLVTPWEKTTAYEQGIVDEDGKVIKKARDLKTDDEKSAYTVFHRLVFNIKRLLGKLPFGKTRIATYAAALFLIKEETGMSEKQIIKILDKMDVDWDRSITESTWFLTESGNLQPGKYTLRQPIASPTTGEIIAFKGNKVGITEAAEPVDYFFGTPIFKVTHYNTKQEIYVSIEDIIR